MRNMLTTSHQSKASLKSKKTVTPIDSIWRGIKFKGPQTATSAPNFCKQKISILKNHVNGLGYEDGRILVTAHDFMKGRDDAEEKKSIEDYKKTQMAWILAQMNLSDVNVADVNEFEDVTEEE